MLERKICYMGDDDLSHAAAYLAGIMNYFGLQYDYISSAQPAVDDFVSEDYGVYVISDYPSSNFTEEQMHYIAGRVSDGAGLVMFGGWESFYGQSGQYNNTPIADVLPVQMRSSDDRRNCAQPCLIKSLAEHDIIAGLPFNHPPGIGGFNSFTAKPEATTVLDSVQCAVERMEGQFKLIELKQWPLLVVGLHGRGRTVALATDVAPHWVGGFVDWGDERLTCEVGQGSIEVGNWYAQFFRNLLLWACI